MAVNLSKNRLALLTAYQDVISETCSTDCCSWVVRLLLLLCLVDHLSAVIEAELYVCPGDTVTLPCDGGTDKDTSEVEVFWKMHGGTTVCLFKNGTWCEHPYFENRIQLGSIRQNNFSLVINDVRLLDQGEYMCLINGAEIQINHLSVRGSRKRRAAVKRPEGNYVCKPYKDKEVPDENPPGAPSSVRLIVSLSVIAGILVIAVIVGLLVWLIRRRWTEPTPNPEGVQADYEMVPQAPPPQLLQ